VIRLPLEYWRFSAVHWARFVTAGASPVRQHWPGLNDSEAIDAIDAQHWHRFAINNNNREEVAVYLRFAWELLRDFEVLGNAYFCTEDAAATLGQAGTIVAWQFETDSEGPPGHVVFKGFTRARSAVRIHPPPTERQRWMRDKTLLFRIATFGELATLLRSVLSDAAGEISLFGTSEAGAHRIIDALQGDVQPNLEAILCDDDIFISLGIGVDLGYNDHIAIASRSDLRPVLESIGRDIDTAIADYEKAINPYVSPDQALALMARLAGQPSSAR
jgi:hypothetical protein